ncbi:MAG TPA: hypothetical protein EYQ68_07200, partial [Cytophagales bacterium]|nr:hypothetical protein [Cytophagales bacterium]
MKKTILFLLVLFSYSLNAQMVPSFQGVYNKRTDSWDSSLKEDCITLSNNDRTATESSCSGWKTVYGET